MSQLLKIFTLTSLLFGLAACSTANTKVGGVLGLDTDFKLTFITEQDVNPDDNNVPSPVIIRLYELKSTKQFKKANFIDLYEQDSEVLGKSMITKQVLKAQKPGEQSESNFVLNKETQFVGLYVEFLQFEDAKYKVTIPIEQTNVVSSEAKVKLTSNRVIIIE